MTAKFIHGLKLSELYYKECVKDLLDKGFPGLKYAAGLIDCGSEVLGFDTAISMDHHWGPRLNLFLSEKDKHLKGKISRYLSGNLPAVFKGYSTNFGLPDNIGVRLLKNVDDGEKINHLIEIYTVREFFKQYIDYDINKEISVYDWLTFSEQKLRTIRCGKIFHDSIGINKIRKRLFYYPKDIWLYCMASEWDNIDQEEAFVGRTGDVGDEVGSRIIAARIVQSIMRLCFFMEKEYPAYSKWFGTAFLKLKSSKKMEPILQRVLSAANWKEREKHLSEAYKIIAKMHNDIKITKPLPVKVTKYHDRNYYVIHAELFAEAIADKMKNPLIKEIPFYIGSVNQFSNTINHFENNKLLKKLQKVYIK